MLTQDTVSCSVAIHCYKTPPNAFRKILTKYTTMFKVFQEFSPLLDSQRKYNTAVACVCVQELSKVENEN